jgi:hypothetical protein
MKELSKKNQKIILKAEKILETYQMKIDTMIIKIEKEFYGYQTVKQAKKRKNLRVSDDRKSQLSEGFHKANYFLRAQGIDVIVCFAVLSEGGATIFVSESALNSRWDVMEKLHEMEKT